jgi:peptidyl-prolyl cis-trans isomerase A (cyclophilin A)
MTPCLKGLTRWVALLILLPASLLAQAFDKGPELDAAKDYYALVQTSEGSVTLKLYADKAPVTVRNFVNLAEGTAEFLDAKSGATVKRPFYDGLQFYRVLPEQFILGGDPEGTGKGGPGFHIPDEIDPAINFEKPGLLAMANDGKDRNGSQFFLTAKVTTHLNQRHTIFGEVLTGTDGVDVIRKISKVQRDAREKPVKPVLIQKIGIHRLDKGLSPKDAAAQIPGTTYAEPTPTEAGKKQDEKKK